MILSLLSNFILWGSILFTNQDTNNVKVVIYQGGGYSSRSFELYVNGKPALSPFQRNTSIEMLIPEGQISIETKGMRYLTKDYEFLLDLKGSSVYYLKAYVDYDFPMTGLYITMSNKTEYNSISSKLKKIVIGEDVDQDL